MDFTINQWAILALVFVLGWLLGLASLSDRRWRDQYERERGAHEALRREHDTLRRDHDIRQREYDTRLASAPAAVERTAPLAAAAVPVDAVTATPSMHRDDLTRIDGIDAHDEVRLNDVGIHSLSDIAALSHNDADALERRLGFTSGRIEGQRWREQAETLAGRTDTDRRL